MKAKSLLPAVPLAVACLASLPIAAAEETKYDIPKEITISSEPVLATVHNVDNPARLKEIAQAFQWQLDRLGWHVSSITCDKAIEMYSIRELGVDFSTGRDYSYGASCTLDAGGRNRSVFMCDDAMIGKFTITGSFSSSNAWMVHFIRENCPPGG